MSTLLLFNRKFFSAACAILVCLPAVPVASGEPAPVGVAPSVAAATTHTIACPDAASSKGSNCGGTGPVVAAGIIVPVTILTFLAAAFFGIQVLLQRFSSPAVLSARI